MSSKHLGLSKESGKLCSQFHHVRATPKHLNMEEERVIISTQKIETEYTADNLKRGRANCSVLVSFPNCGP